MGLVSNIIRLHGEKECLYNLKSFLEQHVNIKDREKDVKYQCQIGDEQQKRVMDEIIEYFDTTYWFGYDWCEIGSPFFDEILDTETLYFQTKWGSSYKAIVEISKLFPNIEFNLSWHPRSIMYECFGATKIQGGCVIEFNNDTPQWYLDEIEEMCNPS